MTETVIVTIAHLELCLKSKQRGNNFHHAVLPLDGSYCIYEEKANKNVKSSQWKQHSEQGKKCKVRYSQ